MADFWASQWLFCFSPSETGFRFLAWLTFWPLRLQSASCWDALRIF